MIELPKVEVVDGRRRFVIPLGWQDVERRRCECSICVRRGGAIPAWVMYEPDVECARQAVGRPQAQRGARRRQAA